MFTITVNRYCQNGAVALGVAAATAALLLSACLMPIDRKDLPALVRELASSGASACLWVGARGGAGVIPTAPTMPAGGYGSGEMIFGRVNTPGTTLTLGNAECVITSSTLVPSEKSLSPSGALPPETPDTPAE